MGVYSEIVYYGTKFAQILSICHLPVLFRADKNLSYVFVADGAFVLNTNSMKPFPGNQDVGTPK
jgi:hypothetical protein